MDTRNKIFLAVGAVAIVAAAAIGAVKIIGNEGDSATASTQSTVSSSTSSTPTSSDSTSSTSSTATDSTSQSTTSTSSSGYADGDYTAKASYYVPHGSNSISVKLTIKDGKVTAVTTDDTYSDHESAYYIDSFNSEIKGVVVGQSLDSLSLSRVGGASLTTEGFNQALDSIISSAKA